MPMKPGDLKGAVREDTELRGERDFLATRVESLEAERDTAVEEAAWARREIARLCAERDQSRAWAAVWKQAAEANRAHLDLVMGWDAGQRSSRSDVEIELGALTEKCTQLEAEAAQMREVLEHGFYVVPDDTWWPTGDAPASFRVCYYCGMFNCAPDCPRQAALATGAGRGMLNRLRKAETGWDSALETSRLLADEQTAICAALEEAGVTQGDTSERVRALLERLWALEAERDEAVDHVAEMEIELAEKYATAVASEAVLDDWLDAAGLLESEEEEGLW
jgi:hypothetical protein